MPTSEYRCEKGHFFSRIQKMSDKAVAKCPECGAKASRIISGGQGLIFKGSGFYITDYGKDGKGPRKDAAAVTESSSDVAAPAAATKGAAKPEAKSEPKTEAKPAPSKPDSK